MKKDRILIKLENHEHITKEALDLLYSEKYELFFLENDNQIFNNKHAKQAKAILVRGAFISKKTIKYMPNLKVIARVGVGIDNIDIDTATKTNIYVCNVPEANFISVAEHVLSMILTLSHRLIPGNTSIREELFDARHQFIGTELMGKTIGIIGFGKIGKMLAQICVYGFNMNVLVYDPFIEDSNLLKVQLLNSPEAIYTNSDFITLHLPYTSELHHFIGEKELKKMKKTAYIINCARGGLIDEVALSKSIRNGDIAGAGIDVYEQERPPKNHVLWDLDEVIVTPHMGASTSESLSRMSLGAVEEIIRVLKNKKPKNALNFNDL